MMGMKMEDRINASLERLDHLGSYPASLKDQINTLKIELGFLRTFFMCKQLLWVSYDIEDRYKKIEAAIQQDVVGVILSLGGGEVPIDLDRLPFSMQEKIELIKLQVYEIYNLLKQSNPRQSVEGDLQVKCIDYVLENMKDLIRYKVNSIVGVKKLINTLERRLRYLRNSLQFVAKFQLSKTSTFPLKEEVGYVATRLASFSFSCWINKMDHENTDLSLALHYKFYDGDEYTNLYRGIIGDSESFTSNPMALLVGFIDFLLKRLLELLNHDGSVEIPTKDYFESLRGDLKLVRSLFATTNARPGYVKSLREDIEVK